MDLWTAAGTGNIEAIRQHVATGTDLNAKEPAGGSTPLLVAALYGQTEAARLLIEKGAKLEAKNNDGATPLTAGSWGGGPEWAAADCCNLFAGAGEEMTRRHGGRSVEIGSERRETTWLVAVFFCQPETAKLLLEKGADVHAQNNRGETPLDTVAGPVEPGAGRCLRLHCGSF